MTAGDSTESGNAKAEQRFSDSYDGHGYIACAASKAPAGKGIKWALLRILHFREDGLVAVAQCVNEPMGGTFDMLTSTLTPLHEVPSRSGMRKQNTDCWPPGGVARLRRSIRANAPPAE